MMFSIGLVCLAVSFLVDKLWGSPYNDARYWEWIDYVTVALMWIGFVLCGVSALIKTWQVMP